MDLGIQGLRVLVTAGAAGLALSVWTGSVEIVHRVWASNRHAGPADPTTIVDNTATANTFLRGTLISSSEDVF